MAHQKVSLGIIAVVAYSTLSAPIEAAGAEKADVAKSLVQFGMATGGLLWTAVEIPGGSKDGDRYVEFAAKLKRDMDQARAATTLMQSNFNVISTTLLYEATVNPDPFTKGVSLIAASGAKATANLIGGLALDRARENFLGALAGALRENNYTAEQLKDMTPAQLITAVDNIKLQGKTFKEVLGDEPGAMEMLQANAADFAREQGTAALLGVKELKGDIGQVTSALKKTAREITQLQENTQNRLETLTTQMQTIEDSARESKEAIASLRTDVMGAKKATQTLAQISFLGWSTQQKLEAVKAGMFPDLSSQQAAALRQSLEADLRRENTVRDLQSTARSIGDLANIASNLGVDPNVVTGLSTAQKGATAVAQYFTGDYLGALSTATSLVGAGRPDGAAQQHAAMMQYLAAQFQQINKKLDQIIDLQQKTLQALNDLGQEVHELRTDVKRVETLVLLNHALLNKLIMNQWNDCWSLIGAMNGSLEITSKDTLKTLLNDNPSKDAISKCYGLFLGKLRQWREAKKWSGEIIDARQFDKAPGDETDTEAGKEYVSYVAHLDETKKTVEAFLLSDQAIQDVSTPRLLARFAQPVISAKRSEELSKALNLVRQQLDQFQCHSDQQVLSIGLEKLTCWGIQSGVTSSSLPQVWPDLVRAPQLGPNVANLTDLGIALSVLADFATTSNNDSTWDFVPATDIETASAGPSAALLKAVQARKGFNFLQELSTLAGAYALQQSMLYGDYTAELIVNVLYEDSQNTLTTKADPTKPLQNAALAALKANPTLARNVLMLAMRRSLLAKGYNLPDGETTFALALADYTGPAACKNGQYATAKLTQLFPGWSFTFVASPDDYGNDRNHGPLYECKVRMDERQGWGAAVSFDGFYVTLPSPRALSEGTYEYPPSLRVALAYRDKVAKVLLDRGFGTAQGFQSQFASSDTLAINVLNQAILASQSH